MSDMDPDLDRLQDLLNAIPAERDGMTDRESWTAMSPP